MGNIGTTTGNKSFYSRQGYTVNADGSYLVVYQGNSTTQFVVARSTNRGDTWADVATLTSPVAVNAGERGNVGLASFSDGSLAVVIRPADGLSLRYAKVATGTWAVSAWETVTTSTGGAKVGMFDVTVTDAGAVAVSAHVYNTGTASLRFCIRPTSGGWSNPSTQLLYSGGGARRLGMEDAAITSLAVTSNIRLFVLAFGWGEANNGDPGTMWATLRVNETNGVVSGGLNVVSQDPPGKIDKSNTSDGQRHIRLFRLSANEIMLTRVNKMNTGGSGGQWQVVTTRQTITASSVGTAVSVTGYAAASHTLRIEFGWGVSASADGTFVWRYPMAKASTSNIRIGSLYGRLSADGSISRTWPGVAAVEMPESGYNMRAIAHGPDRNLDKVKHDFVWWYVNTTANTFPGVSTKEAVPAVAGVPGNLAALTPADGSIDVSSTPTFRATFTLNAENSNSVFTPKFKFARSADMATGMFEWTAPESVAKLIENTQPGATSGSSRFNVTLPSGLALAKGTWYVQVKLATISGVESDAWSAVSSFAVGHPPVGIPVSPSDRIADFNGGAVQFSWTFDDPAPADVQSAFQVTVRDIYGTQVATSGKVTSPNKFWLSSLAAGLKNQFLTWDLQVWDGEDTPSLIRSSAPFLLGDPPAVAITSPASLAVLATGIPTITFTVTPSGGRAVREYTAVIERAGEIIWSKRVTGLNITAATSQSVRVDNGFLVNSNQYSVRVTATDEAQLSGMSPTIAFSTSWTVPATPSGVVADPAPFGDEARGYIEVNWLDTGRDPDFVRWSIYRKDEMLDYRGIVIASEPLKFIGSLYVTETNYTYRDYLAPANHRVTYFVTQEINRAEQEIQSDYGVSPAVVAISEGYWLIQQGYDGAAGDVFKLAVTGDSYSVEQEEEEFVVINRGRIVNKGQRLGIKGTLDAQLRTSATRSARLQKQQLERLQLSALTMFMRTPFGDLYRVNISTVDFSRVAGVGREEFCDVSIPYSEVS